MPFGPVQPARIDFDSEPGTPRSVAFGDVYASRDGALAQAEHVFLRGNGLPQRWRGRPRFVILETGFGLGNNFLATRAAWQADADRPDQLWFVAIEKHPPSRADLARALADSPLRTLADELIARWPALTPDLHLIDFDGGRVRLLLALADIAQALPELVLQADAIYLDGFAPARNPAMWDAHALRRLARLAAPGASVATWSVAGEVRDALSAAGFVVDKAPGFGGKREMTVGRFAPRFLAPAPPGRRPTDARRVTVVGAGLAGAAVANALARQGVAVDVLERRAAPASETSHHAGALFHGSVHRVDGPHSRWLRAAALQAQRVIAPRVADGSVAGAVNGLRRLENTLSRDAMRAMLQGLALPDDWVQVRDAAWFYPGGGWAAPIDLVAHWLRHPAITVRTDAEVIDLDRLDGPVVLANAVGALPLLGQPAWPHQCDRGQTTLLPADPGRHLPCPIAGGGYVLQLADGRILCGATSQKDDFDPAVRDEDNAANLATLTRLTGWRAEPATASGQAGIRLHSGDRLPWIGPVPGLDGDALQARHVARREGLYVLAALGSRGLTHAALAGEVLAAWITGAPMPVPASLLDAVDPARFAVRVNRNAAS